MNTNDALRAHRIMDALCNGNMVLDEEREFLRSFLPERPIQKTREQIAKDVHRAWTETYGNHWEEDEFGVLEVWLNDLHTQLKGVKSEAHPEFLETEEDYAAAPDGTIVAQPAMRSWFKEDDDHWSCGGGAGDDHSMFTTGTHRVLRWGKE